ncbi:MAG: porin [Pseudomonadota bacterium]
MNNTKRFLLIAVSALLFCDAQAESSVTFSGLIGMGVNYGNHTATGKLYQMNGTHAAPFIAVTGREDLGGEAAALFRISNYVFLDTGLNAPLESYVGLSSARAGTVTLGSMYDLLADLVPYTSERYTSLLATHPGNLDRTVGNSLNNTIKYKSPKYASFQFGAMYGVGENDSTTNTGRVIGAEFSYGSGPLEAMLVWESVHGVRYAPFARLGVSKLYGIDFAAAPAATVLQNQETSAAGLAYTADGWRWMANYTHTQLSAATQQATARTIDVGAYTYVAAGTRVGGGYSYTTLATYRWNQLHAHVDYELSRRTSLYALGVLQNAGSGQLAVMRNQPPASSPRQLALEIGMTHRF